VVLNEMAFVEAVDFLRVSCVGFGFRTVPLRCVCSYMLRIDPILKICWLVQPEIYPESESGGQGPTKNQHTHTSYTVI